MMQHDAQTSMILDYVNQFSTTLQRELLRQLGHGVVPNDAKGRSPQAASSRTWPTSSCPPLLSSWYRRRHASICISWPFFPAACLASIGDLNSASGDIPDTMWRGSSCLMGLSRVLPPATHGWNRQSRMKRIRQGKASATRTAKQDRQGMPSSLEFRGVVPAHRCMLAGPRDEDGHYFAAAFRWPAGNSGGGPVIAMPEGLSQEATMMLLRLRYGSDEVEADYILEAGKTRSLGCEARHFAELLDWPEVRKRCEAHLESLLAKPEEVDTASLLAVLSHAEESRSMPGRLKAAALAAAVRQWSRVAEAAEAESENPSTLPSSRQSELGMLNRIRHRDGHVCGSLEEYLYAASDDLVAWERSLALDAPQAAKRKLEGAWRHWHQILFEYGHIFGADLAEKLRERTRHRRAQLREERSRQRGQDLRLPAGKVWFEATTDWQEVPSNAICAAGLEYHCDMQTGRHSTFELRPTGHVNVGAGMSAADASKFVAFRATHRILLNPIPEHGLKVIAGVSRGHS
eukprot:s4165_g4.t1